MCGGSPRGAPLVAALCLVLAAGWAPRQAAGAIPDDLSNFQNEFVCSTDLRVVRPTTVKDIQDAVSLHDKIVPVGSGHSWNKPFFCADLPDEAIPNDLADDKGKRGLLEDALSRRGLSQQQVKEAPSGPTSANIAMTTIRPMTITVDEQEGTAWIDGGISVLDALDYLANYVTKSAPRGWTLPAYPFWVKQTVAGAIATATHGSTLVHGSLSQQVVALKVVLANGTLAEFTPETHPVLMKALRVSLGRLGVITSVKFRIVREQPVIRTATAGISSSEFLQSLREAQDMYNDNGDLPRWMNESQVFWIPQLGEFNRYSFDRGDDPDPDVRDWVMSGEDPDRTTVSEEKAASREKEGPVFKGKKFLKKLNETRINVELEGPRALRAEDPDDPLGVAKGVAWEEPERKDLEPFWGTEGGKVFMSANSLALRSALPDGTYETHAAYLTYPPGLIEPLVENTLYDQYEVAIPLATMADCMAGMLETLYGDDVDQPPEDDVGFRTAALIRFVNQEEGLLSPTHDGPRMYVNMEDYKFYNGGGKRNEPFFRLMAFIRGSPLCSARMHWGKAGWPEAGCWSGAEEYPDTWCDFGCAVQELDPEGKFGDGAGDRWNWEGAKLDKCCNENGYDRSIKGCKCEVPRIRSVEDCPPPPFYTDR